MHRPGQKAARVATYRLLTAGTLEEKIFQRGLSKGELSSMVAAPGGGGGGGSGGGGSGGGGGAADAVGAADARFGGPRAFTPSELRALFAPIGAGGGVGEGACGTAKLMGWGDAREGGLAQADAHLRSALATGRVVFVHASGDGSGGGGAAAAAACGGDGGRGGSTEGVEGEHGSDSIDEVPDSDVE